MARWTLHCGACGREYGLREPPAGRALHCGACGGALAEGRPEAEPGREPDSFRRRTIAGARLKKLLESTPGRRLYRATHRRMRADVRVEVFPAGFAQEHEEALEELFRRAARTRELHSPNVVAMIDLGRRSDCWYIVTEYAPERLRHALDARGMLGIRPALGFAEGILRGLDEIEQRGIVHGGVSPEGVLIAPDGSARLERLGGIWRPGGPGRLFVTPGGSVVRPAGYLAPEAAADGIGPDIRADLHSLGVTLREMLTGRAPVPPSTGEETEGEATAPAADADLPEGLRGFLERLTKADPDERPADAQEALEELRELGLELSRQGEIRPLPAALSRRQRVLRALGRGGLWTVLAVLLAIAAVIPAILMARQHALKKRQAEQSVEFGVRRILLAVGPEQRGAAEEIPPERAAVLEALVRHALEWYPGLELAPTEAPKSASYVLEAVHARGFRRTTWRLRLVRIEEPQQALEAGCAIPDGDERGLARIEEALHEVLGRAAVEPGLRGPAGAPVAVDAVDAAWVEIAAALTAEREADWPGAVGHARRAVELSPGAAPFAALLAFYEAADALRAGGRPQWAPLPEAKLPPQMAALHNVIGAAEAPDEMTDRFGRFLAAHPRSVRGYLLLGLWRLGVQGRPDEALAPLRRAVDLDPGYFPAAEAYVRLLADRDPAAAAAVAEEIIVSVPAGDRRERLRALIGEVE